MTRQSVLTTVLIIVVVAFAAAAAYVLLLGPGSTRYALPECSELPPAADVAAVLQDRADDLEAIRQIDPAIEITVTRPCPDDPDRGAVLITVPDTDAADRVSEVMSSLPGLGVPATVEIG